MFIIPWKLMFFIFLTSSSIFAISASSWFSAWMALEINILSLLALSLSDKSPRNSEASLKYFLVQALASAVLIFSAFLSMHQFIFSISSKELSSILSLSLLVKLGASPFHVWLPQVVEGMSWIWAFIVLSWQKIAPFILLSYSFKTSYTVLFFISIVLSATIGALNGLSQTSLRKILSFSSINHLGWMLSAIMMKMSSWTFYFATYSVILAMIMNSAKLFNLTSISNFWYSMPKASFMSMTILMLSLGGLPPFLGFLPKWLIITDLMNSNLLAVSIMLVMTSLVTLFFYLRIVFPAMLMSANMNLDFKFYQKPMVYFAMLNFLGLSVVPYVLLF